MPALLKNLKNRIAGKDQVALLVGVSDFHVNSTIGLNPPQIRREWDSHHVVGKVGRSLWRSWLEFWEIIEAKKREYNATVHTIANGDLGDINEHSDIQLITQSETEIKDAMAEVADPMARVSDYVFIARGTESHTGENGRLEEWLARDLDNCQFYSDAVASWWVVKAMVGGKRVFATHHPPSYSLYPHTLENAIVRSISYVAMGHLRADKLHKKPDLCIWAHSHTKGALAWGMANTVGVFLPPWQLHTGYSHRGGRGMSPRCVGGFWMALSDGKILDWEFERWHVRGRKVWTEP